MVDPLRFEQVISNLVNNAIKYSPDGGPIDVEVGPDGPGQVSLIVRDHGLGIPPDRREHLFDRFYQAHGEGYYGGLGLGLFISRQIVEHFGGRMWVQSSRGSGACFSFTLPTGAPPTARSIGGFGLDVVGGTRRAIAGVEHMNDEARALTSRIDRLIEEFESGRSEGG